MRNIKTKRKFIALLLALSLPLGALAQGGLFQRGEEPGLHRSDGAALLTNQTFGNPGNGNVVTNQTFGNLTEGVNVTNQTFGAPLGCGLFTLLMVSAGYAAMKSNKRNNKSKKENIK
jgi:hypothetical protein